LNLRISPQPVKNERGKSTFAVTKICCCAMETRAIVSETASRDRNLRCCARS
jgi:hypothetical protein